MKATKIISHLAVDILVIFLLIGLPIIVNSKNSSTDVNAGASIALPDVPSGDFVILMKTSSHEENISKWKPFFENDKENIEVIFDSISILVASSDSTAIDLAKRYQTYLAESQVSIRTEDSTLLVSKVENGYFDVVIFSSEMADALSLKTDIDDVTYFNITGVEA